MIGQEALGAHKGNKPSSPTLFPETGKGACMLQGETEGSFSEKLYCLQEKIEPFSFLFTHPEANQMKSHLLPQAQSFLSTLKCPENSTGTPDTGEQPPTRNTD